MSRNGSTWPGTLPTLRNIFPIPEPPHPSFGRFRRFLRRRERRPAQSPPPLATPEGDRNLSRRLSSIFSRRDVRIYGGPSTDTNDLGFGCLYDINQSTPSLPFPDVATANADMAVSDEYNAYQNDASTSSASPPLSALSGGSFAGLPSSPSMDVALQHSLLGAGPLLFPANPTASTSNAGPSAQSFLSNLPSTNALGLQFADNSVEVVVPRTPQMNYVSLPPSSPSSELLLIPSTHADDYGQYDHETIYEASLAANDDETTDEQYQDTTRRSSASSYRTAPENLSSQREHKSEMVPTLGM